jgi:hypothetical protein
MIIKKTHMKATELKVFKNKHERFLKKTLINIIKNVIILFENKVKIKRYSFKYYKYIFNLFILINFY